MTLAGLVSLRLLERIIVVEITFDLDTSPVGKLPGKFEKAKALGLKYAAQDMTRFLMQNSPVDHGLLRQWFIESIDDEQATIKSPAKYAIYQDQGTRPYLIYPNKKKALFWPGAEHPVKFVAHPGIEGKHFVQNSFEQLQPLVPGYWMKALEEVD